MPLSRRRYRHAIRTPDADAPAADPVVAAVSRTLVALRWAGVVVLTMVLIYTRSRVDRPGLAVACLAAVVAVTLWHQPRWTARPAGNAALAVEAVVAGGLLAADGWVYGAEQTFQIPALGAVWPLAAVLAVGAHRGPRFGAAAGAVVVACRLLGALAPDANVPLLRTFGDIYGGDGARLIPTASLLALYLLAGAGAGHLAVLLRRAAGALADLETRREVARSLHDGVLQSLAVIERETTQDRVAQVARDADRDLRRYLTTITVTPADLTSGLTAAARDVEAAFGCRVTLAVAADLPTSSEPAAAAVIGAAREALSNAAKHAGAARITLYAGDADEGIEVTVVDDGAGFDADHTELRGIATSILERLHAVGGTATIDSRPGSGTEVRLWIP